LAIAPEEPQAEIAVEVYGRGKKPLARTATTIMRPDLERGVLRGGRCGFSATPAPGS
jgi:hypothetical protein